MNNIEALAEGTWNMYYPDRRKWQDLEEGTRTEWIEVLKLYESLRGNPSGIEAIVCKDITARQAFGIGKYGTTVADNPLDLKEWLLHHYQELLDAAVYVRRAIAEIDKKQ